RSALSAPRPNPARGAAVLTLTLAASEQVSVEVLDVLGRRVAVLRDGQLPAGDHMLTFQAGLLPAGPYVVRALGETFRAAQRVTVVD
ncbi:MAG TPA: T9SS type A sorting domain-containing protein, partial [Anaeromyxobacteraceae bacterium]|nr:T9SS type A sorting domain-containing protein [Anaeromyxobacteraceae bacterium]